MTLLAPVLITGATGFVGGHLAEDLTRRGMRVRLLVRDPRRLTYPLNRRMEVVRGDVTDATSLEAALRGVHSVVHLAAILRGLRYSDYERVNVEGTRLLCEAMVREKGARRLVYVSSLAAAGPSRRGKPLTEEDEAHPVSFYGITKRKGEETVQSYGRRLDVRIVRPAAVYGPRDRDVLQYFKMVRQGMVFLHGDGKQEMSFVHVLDLVQAIRLVLESRTSRNQIFFVSGGPVVAWGDLLSAAGRAMGKRFVTVKVPLPLVRAVAAVADGVGRLRRKPTILNLDKVKEARCEAWTCSDAKARRKLGYRPRFDLERGVTDTMAFYRKAGWL